MQYRIRPKAGIIPRVAWSTADALIAYALTLSVVLVGVGLLTSLSDAGGRNTITPPLTVAMALFQGLLVAAAWLFGLRRYGAPWSTLGLVRARLRWLIPIPLVAVTVSFVFTAIYVLLIKSVGIESMLPSQIPDGATGEGPEKIINIVGIGLIGPFTEEVFFRGFLLAALVTSLGLWRGAIVSSALFAFIHLDIAVMIPIFITGLVLAWMYLKTGSIWPPLIAHSTQNLIVLSVR